VKYTVLLLLFTSNVFAADIPHIPVNDSKADDAVNKAVQAAAIQTGIKSNVDSIEGFVVGKVNHAVATFIDDNMPFSYKDAAITAGVIYAVGIRHEVTKSFQNPIVPTVTNSVTISPTTINLTTRIPF